ncbi:hydroxyacid dehydrogenase [Isoptericola croceus]|uniref:hydroxyacid dehydrogenase n=1 Tax=Isoptericola croceus TaxID=3031406 RepID=UPI0023F9B2BA|nr:hydroxyacid dehydrogenase [Isoptericola croceus]
MTALPTTPTAPLRVALAMRPAHLATMLLDDTATRRLAAVAEVHPQVLEDFDSPAARAVLAETDVLLTGWGAAALTDPLDVVAPRLRAVVHTGGNVLGLLPESARHRDLVLTHARSANGRPVAEYAAAMILLAGKQTLPFARLYAQRRRHIDREETYPDAGNNGRAVGIVGASTIGRLTIELLRSADLDVVVYDPYLTEDDAAGLGVRRAELDELMETCSVVSIHAPDVPETRHMIGARQLKLLADGGTLINTARGALVDTDALVAELSTGRIDAVLDVTDPEPLPADHPLWELPNALLTPHVAGSMGNELCRLGETAVTEIERIAAGQPPLHPERWPDAGA